MGRCSPFSTQTYPSNPLIIRFGRLIHISIFCCSLFHMPKDLGIDFSDAKQDRAKKTLEDLLQAAYEIVEDADPAAFTSRSLAGKAGYSLGTLSKRLGSVENVFFWAIQQGRKNKFLELANSFSKFDPKLSVEDFVKIMVDQSFASIGQVSPKVMRYYDDRYTRKNGLPADFFSYIDVMIDPYLEVCQRDQTNTFRIISQDEARLIFKAILTFVERPFANGDPIMGTPEHRRIAVEVITRMLAK